MGSKVAQRGKFWKSIKIVHNRHFQSGFPVHYQFWKSNGMLQHSLGRGVIFLSLQHFIAPALDLIQPQACNDGI